MKVDFVMIFIIMFIVILLIKMYFDSDSYNLKCITSDVDNNTYCVRKRENNSDVVDLLAKITIKMKKMVDLMYKHHSSMESVQKLKENFNPKKIKETLPKSKLVAYSENKGENMAFCVTKKKGGKNLIDENTLIFVALHELAHIMTFSIGHTEEFWKNFKFLLENAVEFGIYKPINYTENNKEYCGMTIKDNPLFS